ncbi:MAG: hypothetical protein O3B86_00185 [Planctomycetota bacterium]|nr:hypothetical protein [Planctomycetota bacterium]
MLRDSLVRRSGPADYFVLCVVLTLSAGCSGDSGPERVKVSGRVTIDGTDVALGTIAFVSRSGGRTAATMINDGEYSISQNDGPTPGPQKVVIQAHRKTGKVLTVTKSLPGPPG